jgi:hypothetical protein
MTPITQTDCCTILGIDPKTLRNWLRHANMPFATHPTDARLKCLTEAQVQQLATLHDRPLSSPLPAHSGQENEALLRPTTYPLPNSCPPEADLGQALVRLQAHVTTMQEQLTQLALELLRERELRSEQRLSVLEALVQPAMGSHPSPQVPAETTVADLPDAKPSRERRSPLAAKARGHSRVLPLIGYAATGTYVVICPVVGELSFSPDSPEWFAWLATLHSFRFLGQQGRLSTYRHKGRSCWMAYRRIHGRRYEYALGSTEHLTIDRLEQMASTLQSHVPSL